MLIGFSLDPVDLPSQLVAQQCPAVSGMEGRKANIKVASSKGQVTGKSDHRNLVRLVVAKLPH
jgi:hypothetical protein